MSQRMTASETARPATEASASPWAARAVFLLVVMAALAAGVLFTQAETTAQAAGLAGADLTRLLRAMAALKMLMAAAAVAAILWRLGAAVTLPWLVAYAIAGAGMAAGPGLIWGMAYVRTGAILLHAGLLAAIMLLWRDPVVGEILADSIRMRRFGRHTNPVYRRQSTSVPRRSPEYNRTAPPDI